MAQHGAANVPGHALVRTGDEFPGEDHQIDAAALFDQLATGADGVAEPVWPPSGEGEMRQQQFHTPPLPGRIVGTDTVILPALGFCGTPGCKLRDRHPGLCSSLEVRSFRTRTPKVMGDAERWEMPSSGRSSGAAVEGRVASTQPTKLVGAKRGRVDTTTSEKRLAGVARGGRPIAAALVTALVTALDSGEGGAAAGESRGPHAAAVGVQQHRLHERDLRPRQL